MCFCSHPFDAVKFGREGMVFTMEPHFYNPLDDSEGEEYGSGEQAVPPLQSVSLHRIIVNIVKTGKTVRANIPCFELKNIYSRTSSCLNYLYDRQLSRPSAISADPDGKYTADTLPAECRFVVRFGPNKDKTLFQILTEGGDLLWQRKQFEDRPDYRINAIGIKAIDSILRLKNEGRLNLNGAAAPSVFTVYDSQFKYFSTPENVKKEHGGRTEVYRIVVSFVPEKDYPFTVRITNGFAPVVRQPDGRTVIETSKMEEGSTTSEFSLQDTAWDNAVDYIYGLSKDYDMLTFSSRYKAMNRYDQENRKNRNRGAVNRI